MCSIPGAAHICSKTALSFFSSEPDQELAAAGGPKHRSPKEGPCDAVASDSLQRASKQLQRAAWAPFGCMYLVAKAQGSYVGRSPKRSPDDPWLHK